MDLVKEETSGVALQIAACGTWQLQPLEQSADAIQNSTREGNSPVSYHFCQVNSKYTLRSSAYLHLPSEPNWAKCAPIVGPDQHSLGNWYNQCWPHAWTNQKCVANLHCINFSTMPFEIASSLRWVSQPPDHLVIQKPARRNGYLTYTVSLIYYSTCQIWSGL